MKSNRSVFSQLLQNASAALIIAAGASWLLLAAAIEYFDQDSSVEIECSVSDHSDSKNGPSTKCISIRSAKHTVLSSSRRPESIIQAPFVLCVFQNESSKYNIHAEKLSFPYKVVDSATYVRAGPAERYI